MNNLYKLFNIQLILSTVKKILSTLQGGYMGLVFMDAAASGSVGRVIAIVPFIPTLFWFQAFWYIIRIEWLDFERYVSLCMILLVPSGSDGKKIHLECWRPGFNPSVGKIRWRRKWQPHSSILAWRIPWTEEPGGLQFMESQRVGHDWITNTFFQ